MNNEQEIWKDVEGYEGLYQVSDKGRVRSIATFQGKWNAVYKRKEPSLLTQQADKDGYLRVGLTKNRVIRRYMVHRLVASAFIDNPGGLPMINHKDQNKQNNRSDNLEWCTAKYNSNYGDIKDRVSAARINLPSVSKQVKMIYDDGREEVFPSISEVERRLGISWKRIRRSIKHNTNVFNTDFKFKYL